jgi:hypothetical protein
MINEFKIKRIFSMTNYFWFVFLNTGSIALAYQISCFPNFSHKLDTKILSFLVFYGMLTSSLVIILGMTGFLTPAAAALFLIAGIIAVFLFRKKTEQSLVVNASSQSWAQFSNGWDSSIYIFLAILSGLFSVYFFRCVLDGVHFGWDDLSYHATAAAHWVQQGKITIETPANYHAYFPFGAELLDTWFMLPFHADAYCSLTGLYYLTLAITAIAGTVYRAGGNISAAVLSSCLFLSSQVVREETINRFVCADMAGTAYILAAIYFLSILPKQTNHKNSTTLMFAMALGLASGTKVTYLASSLILIALANIWVQDFRRDKSWLFIVALFFTTMPGWFWYLRNFLITGNPIFPAALGPFTGPFGVEGVRTKLITWMIKDFSNVSQWRTIIFSHLDWGGPELGLIALTGLVTACKAAICQSYYHYFKPHLKQSFLSEMIPVLTVLLMAILIYPNLPFSGTDNEPNGELRIQLRFLLLPFALCNILFAWFVGTSKHKEVWYGAVIIAIMSSWQSSTAYDGFVAIVGAFLIISFIQTFTNKPSLWLLFLPYSPACLLLFFIVLAFWQPVKNQRSAEYLYKKSLSYSVLERIPDNSRLSWFGSIQYYPLFGRRLQHIPVAVDRYGQPLQTVYSVWKSGNFEWWSKPIVLSADKRSQLIENLLNQQIEYVMVERPNSASEWPDQANILLADPNVSQIHKSDKILLFKLNNLIKEQYKI